MCMSVLMTGQERDRAKVADKYKWNLADIYPTEAAWRAAEGRGSRPKLPKLRDVPGQARLLAADAGRRARD